MGYEKEIDLLDDLMKSSFIEELKSKHDHLLQTVVEPRGLFGIPDLLFIYKKSNNKFKYAESYELKLKNWKRALQQAFKYKAFSKKSYVVIDHKFISEPKKNITCFKKSNIGLYSIKNGEIIIHFKPKTDEPYCKTITKKMINNYVN